MSQLFWHQLDRKELVDTLNSSEESGLSIEAVNERLAEHGWNELAETKKLSPITLFLNQFKDFMVLVLMGATLISGLFGEYLDAITIIVIIVMNAVLGFIQEFRAEKSLQALKELSAPSARVVRNGVQEQIPASELVPGDIILLESGDRVPADVRWLETNGVYVEES